MLLIHHFHRGQNATCLLPHPPPPPPTKNVAIVFHFSGSTVIPRRDWSCKILGLKKVHYGFVEMVNRKSLYALCVVLLYKYYYVIV